MSAKTTLIVVRHGNTFNSGDTILRVGGATDLPLTEKGIAQGAAVGLELAKRNITPAKIFCAPLLRTRRTAEEIAGHFPGITPENMQFLTELPYGLDDGAPEDDVVIPSSSEQPTNRKQRQAIIVAITSAIQNRDLQK